MAAIPQSAMQDPTLAAIDREVERRASLEQPRPYLGASIIGTECERRLWYGFRWAAVEQFGAATLYRFEDGHRTEDLQASRLRLVPGLELHTLDPVSNRQFAVSDFGGHFRGHMDGAVLGILQAPKTWHVWEAKAVNDEKLAKLGKLKTEVGEKQTLAAWDPVYYAQAIIYMDYTGMTRHYLTASSPGGRVTDSVRTNADALVAATLKAKAERVIFAGEPRPKMSEDPAWYQCKWCPAHDVCHGQKLPPVHCRTCAHATPERDGSWSCTLLLKTLPINEQRLGCPQHRYIPALITYASATDADPVGNWIEYRTDDGRVFRNGDPQAGAYSSEDLRAIDPRLVGDPGLTQILSEFGATIPPAEKPAWNRPAPAWGVR